MTFGNLIHRPDLSPLFGPLSADQNDHLVDRLLGIDAELLRLAERASIHVGVPYKALRLGLVLRADGSSAGIHGGPSGPAGDIWFDISPSGDAASGHPVGPPWVVESRLVVFCCDSPEPRGDANTHDLVRLEESADTPAAVLDVLASHVSLMRAELDRRPRELFTMTPHSRLP